MTGLRLLDRVAPGDHVCWTVDDDESRLLAIAGFVRNGLRAGHKVLYTGDDPSGILDGLGRCGISVAAARASGLLEAVTPEDTYLAGGRFDPLATLELWRSAVASARAGCLPGLRVVGDMTWASRPVPGVDDLLWYETEVNQIFTDGYVAGVCLYDSRRFDPIYLRRMGWAHPGAAAGGAPFDPDGSLRVRRRRDPDGIRLIGEADMAGREALRVVMEHVFDDADEVTVDVSELRFADAGAGRALVAAARPGKRLRVVGCSPALLRLLDFAGASFAPGLMVEMPHHP